ncbi:MAG: hypothetical protein FJ090_09310 [Deltaproteobacteria bacterium]|nr:hypothetical protein [Deltaproteobacteria bacterium]
MWLALLLGFAPVDDAPPPAPPVVHLERTAAVQGRLRSGVAWQGFAQRWGHDNYVRFDERNGTPRFLGLAGIDVAMADVLASDIARLGGVDPAELEAPVVSAGTRQGREILRYARRWKGAEVLGDEVLLVVTGGRVGAAWARLTPVHQPMPRRGEVVLPLARGHGVLAREDWQPGRVRYRGRDGTVLLTYDPRRYDSVSVVHEAFKPGDATVQSPARGVTVTDGAGLTGTTATDGSHGLAGAVSIELAGPEIEVLQNRLSINRPGEGDAILEGGSDISWSAAATLHHYWQVYDWLDGLWPSHSLLSMQVTATVDLGTGSCNAYYTDGTINFYAEKDSCNATGRLASVVYHEVGHGIHHYILAGGSFAGDVSEGSADYVSATILDDPEIGAGFFTDGSSIREVDTDRRYPDDITGEVHNDGLVWASFLWNLREQWRASEGLDATDLLFLETLEQGPELTDLMDAVLVADDDDGDWSNGTPHDCELLALLDQHGLGPGAIGVVTLEHQPVDAQASATEGYEISVATAQFFTHCTGETSPTVSAWVAYDDESALPSSGGGWEEWTEVPLSTDGTTWRATLPRRPANSVVKYFLSIDAADGSESAYSHRDVDEDAWRFWVGDRTALACDDIESASGWIHGAGIPFSGVVEGADDWAFGAVTGAYMYDPASAYSGSGLVGTALDAAYAANNAEYLMSFATDLSGEGLMRLFSYRRWLTVEDARYDQARIYLTRDNASYTELWSNPATGGGSTHVLDTGWVLRDHPLSTALGEPRPEDTAVRFVYTLQTDAGLEFGGWNLDDVCLVELDDPAGHYRRAGLVATRNDDGTVALSWETPWINPLWATLLVRGEGAWPTSLDDGVIVDLDLDPTWGEAHAVIDDLPGLDEGTTWYYTLFALGADAGDLYTEAEEGANAAIVSFVVPADTGDTGTPPVEDTGDSGVPEVPDRWTEPEPAVEEEAEAATDCGCGAGTGAGWVAAAAAAVGLRRRPR